VVASLGEVCQVVFGLLGGQGWGFCGGLFVLLSGFVVVFLGGGCGRCF